MNSNTRCITERVSPKPRSMNKKKMSNRKRICSTTIFIVILFSGLLFGTGCKSKKGIAVVVKPPEIAKPTSTELLIRKINSYENTFNYFSAKGEVTYKDPSGEQSLNVSIVMEKDRYIWMNVTVLFGIEAARIKITTDSVIILDRLHHTCIVTDFGYLRKMSNVDLKLKQLQQMIIGNAAFENNEKQSIADTVLSKLIIYTFFNAQKQSAFYDDTFKLSKNILEDRNLNHSVTVAYANPYFHDNNAYPSNMTINIRAEKNVECKFSLSNFVFEKKKESPFSIPGNYEIIKP